MLTVEASKHYNSSAVRRGRFFVVAKQRSTRGCGGKGLGAIQQPQPRVLR